ncbi:MAG TPA: MMPL family transporter [Candidatus Paceibacterota bacterium]|nr:MMPL family transporter [Candidatus Paceibacterota bacterium]
MKKLTDDSLMARFLALVARIVCRYPRTILYSQVVLFVLSIFITVKFLQFDTSRDNLVGSNKKYHHNFLQFKKEFPQQDDLVVVVESENPEKNRQFVERLGARLDLETNLFTDVLYKGDLQMLGNKALLFASETNVADLKKTLGDYQPFIRKFTTTTNLDSLFSMINTEFRTARREANAENESMIKSIPALERIVTQATASLKRPGTPPSPGITALFDPTGEAEKDIYITFANGRIYLVTAHAPLPKANGENLTPEVVARLRQLVEQTKLEVPGLNVGITGEPILEIDEMEQSQKDTTVASVASLIICALIFIYGYQETGRPVKATICLVVGLAYTMAFATIVVGHLNILTITFVPILIGLAIDFGVHLITRYEEELHHGVSTEAALTKALVFTGQGIFTGAFTTAGAFLAMGLTNFKGIQEMGIICGGGLLVCLIPMLTLLPVLLLRGKQNVIDHVQGDVPDTRARIENIWLSRPKTVTIVTAALTILAATQLPKLYFDYNLLNMQSAGLPAVEFEQKLIDSASKSVLFAAVVADSVEDAVKKEEEIKKLPVVAEKDGVDSIARFIAADQTGQLKLIGEIKKDLAGIAFRQPDLRPVDVQALSRTLYSLRGYLGLALDEIGTNEPALSRQLISLRTSIESLRKTMLSGGPEMEAAHTDKLGAFQRALFNDIRDTFQALKNQDNSAPLRIVDLPPALRDRFVGVTGKILLQVYPKKDVWVRENQEEFIKALQTIDKNVTGTPVQLYYYTDLLRRSYQEAALYALGAIVILVLIHFRSITSVVLSLIPVAIGSVWLGGMMAFLGVPLNPANIMTLPLVIGIGVTNGIHILNRFAEEQTPSILAKSTGKAVFVSGLTTIAGFGSLILAKHRGIHSLGAVMAVGVTTCMIAALTFLPALLNLITRKDRGSKQPSAENARSTLGREEPR